MDTDKLVVRHGHLGQLQGPPRKWNDITIAAAAVRLLGRSFARCHTLSEHVKSLKLPADVRRLLLNGYDGPWVRGRIERVFGVTCPGEQERGEKSGVKGEFVAVCQEAGGALLGVPFWCNDHYLRTGLMFSEGTDRTPADLRKRIAETFWSLLLAEPHDLPDYQDQMFHAGAGIYLVFGIAHGQPFVEEHDTDGR